MKFGRKIFLLCMGIYFAALSLTGIMVTENTYHSLLNKEIERSLSEEKNLNSNLTLYLLNERRLAGETIELEKYSQNMVDIFKTDNSYLEFFDKNLNLLASNATNTWFLPRQELPVALEGKRNFILRRNQGQHFLFIADVLQLGEERLVLALIKDLTALDLQRQELYLFFVRVGVAGLLLVALITWIMARFVMRPIEDLSATAQKIASGNYHVRAHASGRDEIGLLAGQFNTMAAEIEQKIHQLEEESDRRQVFIDDLTHELRTPLTSIIGYAELLQKVEYDRALYQKSLGYIQTEGRRMLKLANTLMDLILLREKAYQLQRQPLLPLLAEVQAVMQVKAAAKGVALAIQGEELELQIDRDLIKGVLLNLVDNAINASSGGQNVVLGTELVAGKPSIFVADQGKGMAPGEIARVTEPFYRVEKSRSRQEGGIGLGLTICNEVIKGHGAQLQIGSQPGQGTRVSLEFPKNFSEVIKKSSCVPVREICDVQGTASGEAKADVAASDRMSRADT